MTAATALRLAAYLLAADGLAALTLAGIIGLPGAGLTAAALAAGLAGERLRQRLARVRGLAGTVAVAAAAASVVDLLYLSETVLDGLVHLLLFLLVARLFTMRAPGDARVVAFLAFFMLVAASSASFGVSFLFVFLAYLLLVTWLLLLQHVLSEAEPGPRRTVVGAALAPSAGRTLLALAAVAWLTTLAVTALLFFVIPRVGLAALPFRGRMGPLVTGFTDRVELGAYGQIQTDSSVVMRVHVSGAGPSPAEIAGLRWRGLVFDEFDGLAWSVGQPDRLTLRRAGGPGSGDFLVGPPRRGRGLYQEVFLEPIGTDVIFAAPRAVRVTLRSAELTIDDMGSLSVASPSARLHYVVESEIAEGPLTFPARPRPPYPGGDPALARYLQLPRLPGRIARLAGEVTTGSRDAYAAAVRLTEFLAREYQYTLDLPRRPGLDPVDDFLFVRRSGNCEYFAAALAVMLRAVDIPSRVVAGFQRGEWNPYGRYFTVRMRDAHSWVEAYIAPAGWVTLDPTPRVPAEAPPGAWGLYLDALRMRWYRYVVNWSLRDQVETAVAVQRHAASWRLPRGSWSPWPGLAAWVLPLAAGLGLGAVAVWARRRGRDGPDARAAARPPRFYERSLRMLRRRGLSPAAGETAREFASRVAAAAPSFGPPFAALTAAYERARFGGAAPTVEERRGIERSLEALGGRPGG